MCAIAGVIGLDADLPLQKALLDTMKHRGPDGSGVFQKEDCCLLHARLAVIDPDGGKQPMELTFGGEHYVMAYNGELYNTHELRKELLGLGHVFEDRSDTQVLLHAYAQWGEGCLERLNGIFAFAVWHCRERKLFLARDRMGVKPLFYKCHSHGFLFASEIKTILRYPTVSPELDREGAAQILLLGPGRCPGSGVFRGIEELEPGQCAVYQQGRLAKKRYWYLKDGEHTDSFDDTAQKVRYLVEDSIRRQMVSDVPIGTFLSGGLDSSLITAVCAREMGSRGQMLKTFSLDYENNDRYFTPSKFQPNSDPYYIRAMCQREATDHRWCILTPQELLEAMEAATFARDLPGMADVDFSLLAFCAQIRECVTVALSGECADEIFGGYPWYRDPQIRSREGFPWAQNTQHRCMLLHEDLQRELNGEEFVSQCYLDTCRQSDILPGTSPTERRMKEMMNLNVRWFMQTLLDRKDRMSMFSALEVRVPFCDHRIAEYLYRVPWEMKDWQGKEKGLLRHAMSGWLPEEVLWRKKSPYPKTHDPLWLELVSARLRLLMEKKDAPVFSLVNRQQLQRILDEDPPWPWYGQLMRRPQTIAYFLQVNDWMEKYGVQTLF